MKPFARHVGTLMQASARHVGAPMFSRECPDRAVTEFRRALKRAGSAGPPVVPGTRLGSGRGSRGATSRVLPFKEMGLGLAAAVLIDATLVRTVLVPAAMRLMGDRNWWMPAWLDRLLPGIALEAGPAGTGSTVHPPTLVGSAPPSDR